MRRMSGPAKISLADLISPEELQEMQDSFAEVANVAIRTTDTQGRAVTKTSHAPSLCSETFQDTPLRGKVCDGCLPTFLGGAGIVDDELGFECLPGLKNYIVPLKISLSSARSLIFGYMIIGPVIFMKRKEKEEFRALAESLGVDVSELWSLVLELRVFSYKGIHSLIDMIATLANQILNLAYGRVVLHKKLLRNHSQRVSRKDIAAAGSSLREFLELLLDLTMDITKGSGGSVMLFDRNKKALTIKASHGLSSEVVRETCVKPGEGVAGLAVQTKRSFLVNADSFDSMLADRLKKPDLFSSAIIPIRCRDNVYGVLNVSSNKALPVKFDEMTLSFLTKAASLAAVALERLQN